MNAASLVPDDLWEAIEPLLPTKPPKPRGGRSRIPGPAALGGIIFVMRTGCPWRLLPKELGCGSGTACWRRLQDWQEVGVWEKLHETLLNWLRDEAVIDWSRASLDSPSVRAKRGARRPGRTLPTAASPAPSTTSWWIGPVFRWRCVFRPLLPMMGPSCFRSSMPFRPSAAHAGGQAVLGNARPSCTPTKPTTPRRYAALSELAASRPALRAAGSMLPSGWAGTAVWWNAPCPGCWAFVASPFATSGALTRWEDCSTWPVCWSV